MGLISAKSCRKTCWFASVLDIQFDWYIQTQRTTMHFIQTLGIHSEFKVSTECPQVEAAICPTEILLHLKFKWAMVFSINWGTQIAGWFRNV